ncbi:hypothetical protein V8J88_05510 [Massilia sp. W12]|uniref:hypothetical protein n=1 Tax=Massilia sp. W12 TaxID=3126507 RepID=UPI0030CF1F52
MKTLFFEELLSYLGISRYSVITGENKYCSLLDRLEMEGYPSLLIVISQWFDTPLTLIQEKKGAVGNLGYSDLIKACVNRLTISRGSRVFLIDVVEINIRKQRVIDLLVKNEETFGRRIFLFSNLKMRKRDWIEEKVDSLPLLLIEYFDELDGLVHPNGGIDSDAAYICWLEFQRKIFRETNFFIASILSERRGVNGIICKNLTGLGDDENGFLDDDCRLLIPWRGFCD